MTKIIGYINSGELDEDNGTQALLLDQAGACLDSAESHEIIGQPLFLAEDGWKVASTEVVIGHASPEYLDQELGEWLEDHDESHEMYRNAVEGQVRARQVMELQQRYERYRLEWFSHFMEDERILHEATCVSELQPLRRFLMQHELRPAGTGEGSSMTLIVALNRQTGEWESLEEDDIELLEGFGL